MLFHHRRRLHAVQQQVALHEGVQPVLHLEELLFAHVARFVPGPLLPERRELLLQLGLIDRELGDERAHHLLARELPVPLQVEEPEPAFRVVAHLGQRDECVDLAAAERTGAGTGGAANELAGTVRMKDVLARPRLSARESGARTCMQRLEADAALGVLLPGRELDAEDAQLGRLR